MPYGSASPILGYDDNGPIYMYEPNTATDPEVLLHVLSIEAAALALGFALWCEWRRWSLVALYMLERHNARARDDV